MTIRFMGLDGEMSGCDPRVHRLIELGLCPEPQRQISFMIGWEDCVSDPDALRVNGITEEAIRNAPSAAVVDDQLEEWCVNEGIAHEEIIPVGWAVSTFDLPFVRSALPKFSRFLHHHCIELNALCYSMSGTVPYLHYMPTRAEWKMMALKMAELALGLAGEPPAWHKAGYDAAASLVAWHWLRAHLASAGGLTVQNIRLEGA